MYQLILYVRDRLTKCLIKRLLHPAFSKVLTKTVLRCHQKSRKYLSPCLSIPSLSLRLITTVRTLTIGSIQVNRSTPDYLNSHYTVYSWHNFVCCSTIVLVTYRTTSCIQMRCKCTASRFIAQISNLLFYIIWTFSFQDSNNVLIIMCIGK